MLNVESKSHHKTTLTGLKLKHFQHWFSEGSTGRIRRKYKLWRKEIEQTIKCDMTEHENGQHQQRSLKQSKRSEGLTPCQDWRCQETIHEGPRVRD